MSLASRKLIQATAGATTVDTGDDDFANVVLLLDGDGTSGDNNETFTDSSTNGFTVTENGDVVQGSFSPYGDNWSNYFGGDSGLNFGDVTAVDFDANDWTMEFWWNPQDLSTGDPFVFKDNVDTRSFQFRHSNNSTNEITFLFWSSNTLYNSETNNEFVYSSGFNVGEWYHIALVHDSGTFECFVNGTSIGTWTPAANNIDSGTDTLNVGYYSGGTPAYASGYLSNVRVVNGTALYTSSFTPSTSPLTAVTNTTLLTCQSNSFKDNSSNDYSVTLAGTPKVTPFSPLKNDDARDITTDGGSANFDSNEYLTIADNSSLDVSGAMTAEIWVYFTDMPDANIGSVGSGYLFNRWTASGNQRSWGIFVGANGAVSFYVSNSGSSAYTTSSAAAGSVGLYRWHHVAISWDGSNQRLFIDGDLKATTANTSGPFSTSSAGVTVNSLNVNTTGTNMNAYYSDARYFADAAIYTSSFTPPTSPLTATSGSDTATVLLNFQDAGIYDRSGINNLDTVGDARLGFAPIYGTGSLAFDGTGDYLSMPVEPRFDFGTANFTIESWVNLSATGQFNPIIYLGRDTYTGIVCDVSNSNNPRIVADIGGSWGVVATGSTALTTDQWYHLAFVRNGSSLKIYVDGVEDASATNSGSISAPSSDANAVAQIGYQRTLGGADRYFNGYLDDVRVTKGVARYTSAFTPPDEIDLSTDTHAEYVTLFLDGDGTVNGQNNTFTDSSTNDFTVTKNGSVAQGVFSPYGDNWSNNFNSSDERLDFTPSFSLGSNDFTIEMWVNPSAASASSLESFFWLESGGNDFLVFRINNSNNEGLEFRVYDGNNKVFLTQGSDYLENGEWVHVAATKSGSTYNFFVNGTSLGTATYATALTSYSNGHIGAWTSVSQDYAGYISNVRVVNGTALYTSNFTPPTSYLTAVTNTVLLTCQSNRFVDNSSSPHTLTLGETPQVTRFSPFESNKPYDITVDGGSAYLTSSSEYLSVADNSAFDFGSGDFTIECWANTSSFSSAYNVLISQWNASSQAWIFRITSSLVGLYANIGGTQTYTASVTNSANQWDHFAVAREGSSLRFFKNGALLGTSAISGTIANATSNITVGILSDLNSTTAHDGYISDLRVVKGTAVYTSAFTPPTAPLTAVTNTELLLNFQDSAIPDLSGLNNIDTVGNAKVGGTDPTKYGSNAMQFDGSGDYLQTVAGSEPLYFTGQDFTVEGWVYLNNLSSDHTCFYYGDTNRSTSNASGIAFDVFYRSSDGYFRANQYYASAGGFGGSNTLVTPATTQWYHVAYYRIGSQFYLAVNGNVANIGNFTQDLQNASDWVFRVGKESDSIGKEMDGFIDDVRVTMGMARYGTSNFTPPDAALPKF